MPHARRSSSTLVIVAALALPHCSSSSTGDETPDAGGCFPDNDGITGGTFTIELAVDDTGFFATGPDAGMKDIVSSQNSAQISFTLKNTGTKPHGFKVECTPVAPAYPDLPAGCPTTSCFPAGSTIAPIDPGKSVTVTFDTPVADGLLYPFTSNEAADKDVPALNDGQWSLM